MVSDKTLSFPSELLRPVYELYLDLAAMFVTSADE